MTPDTLHFTEGAYQSLRLYPRQETILSVMLRTRRLDMGISAKVLARQLDCDPSYVSRLESGQRVLNPDMIPTFAAVLNLDPHDLALAIAGLDAEAFRESLTAPLEAVIADIEAVLVRFRGREQPPTSQWRVKAVMATARDDEREAA